MKFPSKNFDFKDWINIESGDEIVRDNWTYNYDMEFFNSPSEYDFAVPKEWIGKRAKDCVCAWEYCMKPIENFCI